MAVRKVDWVQKVVESFRQTLRNASGYRKYGLRAEDTLSEEDPDVAEGIKKLPKEEYLLRLERLRRANDLSMKHRILARDQWTKPEEPVKRD
ncbi:cytochrome b-c1 complex subunit 7-like isoform X2 [Dysidea avara]|uniref:cytochrome b-c1 complex subunit 7-like isoform X2 n=1 Tax=Dysidea avara TaxID=196820 RepID=UPI00332AACCD